MLDSCYDLITEYFKAFNAQDMPAFYRLIGDDVIHNINQGSTEKGIKAFTAFMDKMNESYQEKITDLIIMVSKDNKHAAAEFTVKGKYLKSAAGLPPAHGQEYLIKAGAFFQIDIDKITQISVYYNLNEWIKQVS